MPTDEERTMIADAKAAKPDLPLEPAEEFLYTLSSIPELKARLSLLKFNYEFQQVEEVCMCTKSNLQCDVCVCKSRLKRGREGGEGREGQ
jgi:hypothetical protein